MLTQMLIGLKKEIGCVGFSRGKKKHALSKWDLKSALQAFFKYHLEIALQMKHIFSKLDLKNAFALEKEIVRFKLV